MTQEWPRIGPNLLSPFTKSKPSHQVTIGPRPSRRLSALYKAWSAAVEGRSKIQNQGQDSSPSSGDSLGGRFRQVVARLLSGNTLCASSRSGGGSPVATGRYSGIRALSILGCGRRRFLWSGGVTTAVVVFHRRFSWLAPSPPSLTDSAGGPHPLPHSLADRAPTALPGGESSGGATTTPSSSVASSAAVRPRLLCGCANSSSSAVVRPRVSCGDS
jgi:hypothetical protein